MSENHTLRYFTSSDREHKVAVYTWLPDRAPIKGIVQIIHGMREYMGRYSDFAAFLRSQGYIVCGHDHLGHGRTARDEKDFGFFGPDRGCNYLLSDCKRVTRLLSRDYPELPLFLLGHSMGSFIGRIYILRPPVKLAGFICMGTGGEIKAAPVSRAALELSSKLFGDKSPSPFLNLLVVSPILAMIRDSSGSWLSRDMSVAEAFNSDPLSQPLFTNRGLCDLITLQIAATSKEWASRIDPNLPILLLSGDSDLVGHKGKGVVQTYERLQLAGCKDVRCTLYEGARHELLNEINKEEIYYDIREWLSAHLPTN